MCGCVSAYFDCEIVELDVLELCQFLQSVSRRSSSSGCGSDDAVLFKVFQLNLSFWGIFVWRWQVLYVVLKVYLW